MLKNKIVFITGSSSGIGKETALLCAREKAQVIVTYNKEKKEAEKVIEECKQLGSPKTALVKLDTRNNSDIKAVAKEVKEKFGVDLKSEVVMMGPMPK
jgi:NAD(P)-dependent dehydrogenase (short-subunit alcohol dehydrogenase family)